VSDVRKIFIVGGAGFIGYHVVLRITAAGIPVRVFDRDIVPFQKNIGDVTGLEIVLGNLENYGEVESALDGVTDVLYFANTTVPSTSMKDLEFDLESNIPPLISMLQVLRERNTIRRFIYLSSGGTIYGNTNKRQPIREDCPKNPISSYGLVKLIAEHYIRIILSATDICSFVLRPSNVYGEWQNLVRPQGIIGYCLKALAQDSTIVLYGDGSVVRDYLYAGDLSEAIWLCLNDRIVKPGEIRTFNVGSNQGISLMELLRKIECIVGKTFIINHQAARGFDCQYNVLDCSAIHHILSWQPEISLEKGIEMTWSWIQERFL